MERLLRESYGRASECLRTHRKDLEIVAKSLLKYGDTGRGGEWRGE